MNNFTRKNQLIFIALLLIGMNWGAIAQTWPTGLRYKIVHFSCENPDDFVPPAVYGPVYTAPTTRVLMGINSAFDEVLINLVGFSESEFTVFWQWADAYDQSGRALNLELWRKTDPTTAHFYTEDHVRKIIKVMAHVVHKSTGVRKSYEMTYNLTQPCTTTTPPWGKSSKANSSSIVYPNPTSDYLNVRTENPEKELMTIQLYSNKGILAKEYTTTEDVSGISISDLIAGDYILWIKKRNEVEKKHIQVKK